MDKAGILPTLLLEKFSAVSISDIQELLLSVKSGSPYDPCPPSFLKMATEPVSDVLCTIVNRTFEEGIFPKIWKTTSILPLLKKPHLDPMDSNNYRPISRLPLLAKIIEKIMNKQLSQFLDEARVLDPT